MRQALNCLALVAPDWLLAHSQPEWAERYEARMEDARTHWERKPVTPIPK